MTLRGRVRRVFLKMAGDKGENNQNKCAGYGGCWIEGENRVLLLVMYH